MLFFVAILPIFIVGVEKGAYPKRGAIFLQWCIKIHLSKSGETLIILCGLFCIFKNRRIDWFCFKRAGRDAEFCFKSI